jgi:uridylate kinase
MASLKKLFVLSVGGSLVVPKQGIDIVFLRQFKRLIMEAIKQGNRFVLVVGGGSTCRHYQEAAKKISLLDPEDLDWLGIHSTRLNGHLLRTIFRVIAHPVMCKDPTRLPKNWKESVLVLAGWKPGWSTDYVAVRAAKQLRTHLVVNLSNIDYVYSKDPKKNKSAKPFLNLSWKEFRQMIGNTWDPGMNVPFDPVASRLAQESQIRVVVLHGKKMKNVQNFFEEKPFQGTVIE